MSSCLIAYVGMGLLDPSHPPASASCGTEITGANHRISLNYPPYTQFLSPQHW